MNIYEFWHRGDQDFSLTVRAVSKVGAFKVARILLDKPEKWVLTQIRELTDCHIPMALVEPIPSSDETGDKDE